MYSGFFHINDFGIYNTMQIGLSIKKWVLSIKKWVDINKYNYVCIKMVHACMENRQYALTMQVPFGDIAL